MKSIDGTRENNDGGHSRDLYSRIPCTIGYRYLRVEVDGKVRPCCISRLPVGNINLESLNSIWHSKSLAAFRQKLLKINKEKFHLSDPEWAFCQQCSHRDSNQKIAELLSTYEDEIEESQQS